MPKGVGATSCHNRTPDLHRAGLVHVQEALLPVISDGALPTVFLVSHAAG